MAEDRLKTWETLFQRALEVIDSVGQVAPALDDWSFGGGTALMRRHRHRLSKDIDIFIADPQYLSYLSPRLSPTAESMTSRYLEQAGFVKLYFPEGEIDFVVAAPLTSNPTVAEPVLGRTVQVETSAEIIAKKIHHRGQEFTARDLFDFALISQREPDALVSISAILHARRDALLERITRNEAPLRTTFAALETLDFNPSFEDCVAALRKVLG